MRCASAFATLAVLSVAAAALPAGAAASSVIGGGQTLVSGQYIESPDGHYALLMQSSGNLVEIVTGGFRILWQSNTAGNPGAYAVLKPNGELVIDSAKGSQIWSDSATTPGCPALNVLNDGRVQVDGPSSAVWGTGANTTMQDGDQLDSGQVLYSPNDEYVLGMQSTGDLVLLNSSGTVLWASGTEGNSGAYAELGTDGDLRIYPQGSDEPVWTSNTAGHAGDYLTVLDAGLADIFPANEGPASGYAIWSSNTAGVSPGSGDIVPVPAYGSSVACGSSGTKVGVTPPSTGSKVPQLKVPVDFYWSWRGSDSYLSKITFSHLPSAVHWKATVVGTTKGAPKSVKTATTTAQRRALLLWLEHRTYTNGQTVELQLTRSGDKSELIEFRVRLHKVPELVTKTTKK